MAFISRLLNKSIANLKSKFNVQPQMQMVQQSENNFPLEGMGDHHRFLL